MCKFFSFTLVVFILISCKQNNSHNTTNPDTSGTLAYTIDSLQLKKEDLSILIDKSDFTLSVLVESTVLKKYSVVFGTNPIVDKVMEGDRATPEGHFLVRDFYPHKSWSKFIWIDYPTKDSWRKHNKAKAENRIPNEAAIGGEIGIHGVPDGKSNLITDKTNWTWGCISLTNTDVEELYDIVYKNMEIEIVK